MDDSRAARKPTYHHGDLRTALLEAAEAELVEKGIEGFTLRGVAKRAGVSHAAPAHHFRDTGALLTALASVAAERFAQAMEREQMAAGSEAGDGLVAAGVAYVRFSLENPALIGLLFGSRKPDFNDDGLHVHAARGFTILVDAVAAWRGPRPLESETGRLDVATAWALVHGIAQLLIAGRMRFLQDDLAADRDGTIRALLRRTLIDGLPAVPERRPPTSAD